MKIEKKLAGLQKNILLKNYTTFKIGGKARYFFIAKNKKDIISAILVAKKLRLPFFNSERSKESRFCRRQVLILGGGSNILVSDRGFKGLIIKIENKDLKIKGNRIFCEAGGLLSLVVYKTVETGLTGLEWAAGIPGTLGGAIYGNAGAFGKSMGDITKTVTVLEIKNQKPKIKIFKNKNCKFSYRDSIFKHNRNLIILSAVFQLKKGNKTEVKKRIKEYLNYRRQTQPLNFPSAGSVFKNPPGFFAGELVERCGLKGKKIGNVEISEKHANFIVNLGNGKAKDVEKLINLIKSKVKKKFGVVLEEEIQYLSF